MSNRTADANKAIAEAWRRERDLVAEGNGTRDWSHKHQFEISSFGKAYDDNGRAFEGQHMKSVQAYPKFQGDSNNIQLLSREEHLAAHNGSFRNPTNGYYDYQTGQMSQFRRDSLEACPVKPLSSSIHHNQAAYMGPNVPQTQTREAPSRANANPASSTLQSQDNYYAMGQEM